MDGQLVHCTSAEERARRLALEQDTARLEQDTVRIEAELAATQQEIHQLAQPVRPISSSMLCTRQSICFAQI